MPVVGFTIAAMPYTNVQTALANRHDGRHPRFRVPPQQGQRFGAVGPIARGCDGFAALQLHVAPACVLFRVFSDIFHREFLRKR
jgi:hypothetical protein